GEIAVAFRLRPQRHRLERVAAVDPVRVRVKVAPDVADRDERGKGMPRRRVDLAAVLAQLRRDPVHLERGVDLLFAGAGELLAARLGADAARTKAAMIGGASSLPATMSTSPIVSRKRRRLPAIASSSSPLSWRSQASIVFAAARASLSSARPVR